MSILGKFQQQPGEVLDYNIDFATWFENRSDAPMSAAVTVEDGITLEGYILDGTVLQIIISGGADGGEYKVTSRLTTDSTPPRVKEVDFIIQVREY